MKFRSFVILGGFVALALPATVRPPTDALAAPVAPNPGGAHTSLSRVAGTTRLIAGRNAAPASSSAYALGQRLLKAGKYGAAEDAFKRAIKAHDHTAAAYAGLGTAAIGKRDFIVALSAFQHATALDPRQPDYQYDAAYAALYSADYHKAVKYAGNYIHLRPRDPKGYHLRFLAYGQLLQRKQQVVDAGQVVRLDPKNPSAYNDFGIALSNDGKYAKSVQVLSYAIHLDPKNPLYYANRGQAEYQLRQYVASLKDFERARALTTDPTRRKQYDPAIAYLRKKTHR